MKQRKDPVLVSVARTSDSRPWLTSCLSDLLVDLLTWKTRRESHASCTRRTGKAKCECLGCAGVASLREAIRDLPTELSTGGYQVTLTHRSGEKVQGTATDLHGVKETVAGLRETLKAQVAKSRTARRTAHEDQTFGHVNFNGRRLPVTLLRSQSEEARKRGTVADWKVLAVKTDYGPLGGRPHVGVEIECGVDRSEDDLRRDFAKAGIGTKVSVTYDGSVHVDGRTAVEVRVCDAQERIAETLRKVCAVLSDASAKVNKTCGLHVHLDMRKREWRACYTKLYRMLPWLYAIVSESRRSGNEGRQFCKRNGPHPPDGDRYYALNVESVRHHNTLEVRLHHGTTDPTKIINWVFLLTRIVDGPDLKQTPKTLWKLSETYKLPTEISAWLSERAQFAKDEGLTIPAPFNGEC